MSVNRAWLPLLAAAGLILLHPPMLLLLVPGIAACYGRSAAPVPPGQLLAECLGLSLAFWIVAFWYAPWLGLPLSTLVMVMALLMLVGLAVLVGSGRLVLRVRMPGMEAGAAALLVAGFAGLRLLAVDAVIVPAGADMSMHTYIAVLISLVDGVPTTYQPLVQVATFSGFPVGFQALAGLWSLLSGLEVHQAAQVITCITYLFFSLALFGVLERVARPSVAAVVTLIFTFLTKDPAAFVGWGGNPTVLASAFFLMLCGYLIDLRQPVPGTVLRGALVLAALMATHTLVLVQAFYLLVLASLVWLYERQRGFLLGAVALGAVALLLLTPYLLRIDPGVVTPAVMAYLEDWIRNQAHSWSGSASDAWQTIPAYLGALSGGSYLAAGLVLAVPAFWLSDRHGRAQVIFFALMIAAGVLLVLNTRYWILPLSYLVYPERVVLMLLLPFAALASIGLDRLALRVPGRAIPIACLVVLVVWAGLQARRKNEHDFIGLMEEVSVVTAADYQALQWLRDNTPPDAIIATQYGDAGLWVPAVARRQATTSHINLMYLDKHVPQPPPSYAFVGEFCVYAHFAPCVLADSALVSNAEEVFAAGDARVYRLPGAGHGG